jgi:toxin ParE1/3/4
MAQITWTEEAQRWLIDTHEYIAEDNPAAAQRVALGIHATVQLLRQQPRLGYRYSLVTDREVRILLHGHYRIAYVVHRGGGDIDILGVFHGALPIERYLL